MVVASQTTTEDLWKLQRPISVQVSEVENTYGFCVFMSIAFPCLCRQQSALRPALFHTPCPVTWRVPCTQSLRGQGPGPPFTAHIRRDLCFSLSLAPWALVTEGRGWALRFRTVENRNTVPSLPAPGCLLKPAAPNTSSQDKYRSKERDRFHWTVFPSRGPLLAGPCRHCALAGRVETKRHRPKEKLFHGENKRQLSV